MDRWAFKMAWRDSRGSRRHLALFLSSMTLGVAALVAINAFGENLERTVDDQARALLGADLSIESRKPFSPQTEALIDSLGGSQARRVSFASMALFTRTGDTRLATIRAIEGDYPYYGQVVTRPPEAADGYLSRGEALVDATLFEQIDLQIGDTVRIGSIDYPIGGSLEQMPRENQAMSLFGPRIYIPLARLDTTLLSTGSRAEYEVYFKFEDGTEVEALVDEIQPRLEELNVGYDTVEEVRDNWNEGLTNLYRFLSLVGFVALLLGGIGVASAVHVYILQRIETVGVLRCLGAESGRTFSVYVLQAVAMGLAGGIAGSLLGLGVQMALPVVLSDFLPLDIDFFVSWRAMALGIGAGVAATVLFTLPPLLGLRRVSPLVALRASYEPEGGQSFDGYRILVYLLIAGGITAFAMAQAPERVVGLWYAAGVAVVFALLALVAVLIMKGTRRFFPSSWPYPWRQGLANLYRPHNQTLILMLSIGLGAFLLMTLFLVQQTLLAQINVAGGEGRPDLVFFDIQTDEVDDVTSIVQSTGLPILDRVPIVTMRLSGINGRTMEEMREDSTVDLSWAHRREYRSSYRGYLTETEKVVEGQFVGEMPPEAEAVPISVEMEVAGELGVGIGDTLVFDVQGLPFETVVTSLREVDWRQMATNFFVLFPTGVLEEAPQFYVLLSRAGSATASAAAQRAVVESHPSVSAVDLSLVLRTFDALFGRISSVIRFMALFSILTGVIVLIGAVVVSRYQRAAESVLLKTLGASRGQVIRIMLIEYLFLGFFAALTGLVLALGAGWLLARFVFETAFAPAYGPLAAVVIVVTGLTVLIGLLNSRGIYDRPALEVLRTT